MSKQTIIIHGTEHPFQSLQKLLGGFCHPKKAEISDEDTVTEGTHISEPDLTSQVHTDDEIRTEHEEEEQHQHEELEQHEIVVSPQSRAFVFQPESKCDNNNDEDEGEGEEVALPNSMKLSECEKQPEIIATSLNRRKRVTRGLGVALVAILAVIATLFTLHRLGYDLADITFTSSDSSEALTSKPLIKIQYNNDKKMVEMDPVPSTEISNHEDVEPETFESINDEVDRLNEKLAELKAIVADIQNDSEL